MSRRITKTEATRITAVVRRRLIDDLVENPEAFLPALMGDLDHQLEILDFHNLSAQSQAEVLTELGFNPTNIVRKPVCAECGSDEVQVDGHAMFDEDLGDWVLQGIRDDTYACNSEECGGEECSVNWVVVAPKDEDGAA
jgi:hypothetical protein